MTHTIKPEKLVLSKNYNAFQEINLVQRQTLVDFLGPIYDDIPFNEVGTEPQHTYSMDLYHGFDKLLEALGRQVHYGS